MVIHNMPSSFIINEILHHDHGMQWWQANYQLSFQKKREYTNLSIRGPMADTITMSFWLSFCIYPLPMLVIVKFRLQILVVGPTSPWRMTPECPAIRNLIKLVPLWVICDPVPYFSKPHHIAVLVDSNAVVGQSWRAARFPIFTD